MKKILALTALSAVAGFAGLAGLAGSANAADADTNTGYIKRYAISYTSPADYSYMVHKGLPPSTPVDTRCVRQGQEIGGNSYWFLIEKDGELGYVHADYISAPARTPAC